MREYRMEVLVEQSELEFSIKSMHVDYQREPENSESSDKYGNQEVWQLMKVFSTARGSLECYRKRKLKETSKSSQYFQTQVCFEVYLQPNRLKFDVLVQCSRSYMLTQLQKLACNNGLNIFHVVDINDQPFVATDLVTVERRLYQ